MAESIYGPDEIRRNELSFNDIVSPIDRARKFREACSAAAGINGSTIYCPAGTYDFEDDGPIFPEHTKIIGYGTEWATVFLCSEHLKVDDPSTPLVHEGQASAFTLSHNSYLENLKLVSTVPRNRQATVLGFSYPSQLRRFRFAEIKHLWITGCSWGLYLWQQPGDTVVVSGKSIIDAANVAVTLGHSGGVGSQTVSIYDSLVKVTPSLSDQGGSVIDPFDGGSIGILQRGGILNIRNVDFEIYGQQKGRGPNLTAIQDHLGDPVKGYSGKYKMNIESISSVLLVKGPANVEPDKIADIHRIFLNQGTLKIGGNGSGTDGSIVNYSKQHGT